MPKREAEQPFAQRLREKRLTQVELAAKVGVAPTEVSRWSNGLIPKAEMRGKLARVLRTPANELFPHAYEGDRDAA
jgi:transcriptional regulator with XRE-family HTH domain